MYSKKFKSNAHYLMQRHLEQKSVDVFIFLFSVIMQNIVEHSIHHETPITISMSLAACWCFRGPVELDVCRR